MDVWDVWVRQRLVDVREGVRVPVRVAVGQCDAFVFAAGEPVLLAASAVSMGGERDLRRDVFRGGRRDVWVVVHSLGQPVGADAGAPLWRVRAPTRSRGGAQEVRHQSKREVQVLERAVRRLLHGAAVLLVCDDAGTCAGQDRCARQFRRADDGGQHAAADDDGVRFFAVAWCSSSFDFYL